MARRTIPNNPRPKRESGSTLPDWELINLNLLVLDSRLQPRVQLDRSIVHEYCTLFRHQAPDDYQCPAIIVYYINGTYLVADGHHRVTAARLAGRDALHAHVIRDSAKTLEDAWLHSMQLNITNGLSYTNKDKHRIVTWLLQHPTYTRWTNKDLERLCKGKITDQTFENHRKRLKMLELSEEKSNLDQAGRQARNDADNQALLAKANRELHKQLSIIAGIVQEIPGTPAALTAQIQAARSAVNSIRDTVELLFDWSAD